MKLKSAQFENYRCFDKISIDLHPQLNVFVGENGAGKTAAIEGIVTALSMLNKSLGINVEEPLNRDLKISFSGEFNNKGSVKCQTTDDEEFEVGLKSDPLHTEETRKIGVYRDLVSLFQRTGNGIRHDPALDTLLPVYAFYPASRHMESPQAASTDKNKFFSRLDALNSAGSAFSNYGYVVDWLYDLYVGELIARDNGESSSSATEEREFINQAVNRVIPEVSTISFTKNSPRKLLLKWKNANGDLEDRLVSQLSDGYRTMLTLVIDFARRLVQANPNMEDPLASEAVLLVDEIDLHLHPAWQQRIITDLRKAFPNVQLIVTTHSPQVISSVQPESVFIFSNGQYERAFGQHTYGVESYRVLEDIFGVSPTPEIEEINHLKQKYISLIESGDWTSPAADELRNQLEAHLGRMSPFMINASAEIQRKKRKAS